MAKDGTARGGARPGSGQKKKPLADRILEGKARASLDIPEIKADSDIEGVEMPQVEEWMNREQKNGIPLRAAEVFQNVWEFLVKCGCEMKVSRQLVSQYSMIFARWIQCEEAISKYGLIAKHPTTGGAMTSPYVQMSREYSKQANTCWYQISQVIKDNSEVFVDTQRLQSDMMEDLLLTGKGKRA